MILLFGYLTVGVNVKYVRHAQGLPIFQSHIGSSTDRRQCIVRKMVDYCDTFERRINTTEEVQHGLPAL